MKAFTGKSSLTMLLCLSGLLSFIAPTARADEEKDPPTRVARISFVEGSVSLQPGGQGDWGSAARNRPMTIGDKIWSDKDSRAELQAGTTSIHIGSMTALSFLNLDQGMTQMRLAEGSINFRISELREGEVCEVDAPNIAFTVKEAGAFRIEVNENGDATRVTAIRGEGEVTAGGNSYEVRSGERAEFNGIDDIQYSVDKAPGPDGLDRWASERDRKEDGSDSAKYVSRDMVGSDDLDDYGDWRDEPDYGHVWYPRDVDPGWAPYSNGSWNWVGPWGWTWVDSSPWGFAPFHYGRWNSFGGRWGWSPGPIFGPPIYGPAFVGFLGGGFGVGWFPLGFGEPFYPWFGCRHEFVERINFRNTFIRNRNVLNANARNFNFVHAHDVKAVTVANRNAFASGQAINRGATRLTPASLKGAQVSNSVGIKPTPHSALGSVNMRSNVATPSAAIQNRAVLARTAPAQGASHSPVRKVNENGLTAGRVGNAPATNNMNPRAGAPNASTRNMPALNGRPANSPNTSAISSRQRELSQSRPPSSMTNSNRTPVTGNNASERAGNGPHTWEAQGNTSDRGRPPAGFGSSSQTGNSPSQATRGSPGNRPPWARGDSQSGAAGGRSYQPPPTQRDTPAYNNNRGYSQPRAYNPPPTRSNSAPRTYSAPSRSYPAPSRSSSAPSHSSGGGNRGSSGGGSPHGGGGSASHGRH